MQAPNEAVTTLRSYRVANLKDYKIMVEYKLLKEDAPRGVYLLPAFESLRLYHGVIFLEAGLYKNAVFKFRLELPAGYPADGARPVLTFVSRVYHPLVHPGTLELDLAGKFPQWTTGMHHMATVLKYLKQVFYLKDYDVAGAVDPAAAQAFAKDRARFVHAVEACVQSSIERRFVSDPESTVRFTEYNAAMHELYREVLLRRAAREQEAERAVASADGEIVAALGALGLGREPAAIGANAAADAAAADPAPATYAAPAAPAAPATPASLATAEAQEELPGQDEVQL